MPRKRRVAKLRKGGRLTLADFSPSKDNPQALRRRCELMSFSSGWRVPGSLQPGGEESDIRQFGHWLTWREYLSDWEQIRGEYFAADVLRAKTIEPFAEKARRYARKHGVDAIDPRGDCLEGE